MYVIFAVVLLIDDREVFRPTAAEDGAWSSSQSWRSTQNTPGGADRVLIPGRNRQQRSIVVGADSSVDAASLFLGTTTDGEGTLTVLGSLRVGGDSQAADPQVGIFAVGRNRGEGTVLQSSGSKVTTESLVVGGGFEGTGSYLLRDSLLIVNESLDLANQVGGSALLDLYGNAGVRAQTLTVGDGRLRLRFAANKNQMPRLTSLHASKLNGGIRVDLREFRAHSDEALLVLDNQGAISGGFGRVRIDSGHGQHYELSYFGGDGNDIVLNPVSPATSFEQWTDRRFGTSEDGRYPGQDPDADGVINIAEYKLGRCPKTNEGSVGTFNTNSAGLPTLRYVERTDRDDIRCIPQFSKDGRLWSATGVTTRVIARFGNTRTIKVTADDPTAQLRLHFEMVPTPSVKPNVVFVVVDDLSDWVEGFGGHPQAITPNFARVASQGIRFTNAHANATICNPSRVSMLTGRWPSSTGIYDNDGALRKSPVLANARTIPENFKASGYRIIGGGKLFHGDPLLPSWDDYFPSLTRSRPGDPSPPNRPLNGITTSHGRFDWGPVDAPNENMGDAKVAAWATEQLEETQGSPFFMSVGFYRPHLPFYVPPAHFEPWNIEDVQLPIHFEDDMDDLPPMAIERLTKFTDHQSVLDQAEWKKAVHAYLACVHFADKQLGAVLNALEQSPQRRDTILVVTSDHGWQLGEKTAWRKNTMWERATRVPLMVVAPGMTTPGSESTATVSLVDLFPTFNELCGLDRITPLDGKSLVPFLRDPNRDSDHSIVTTQFYKIHAVRTSRWRFIQYSDGAEELYDRSADPHERFNLANNADYTATLQHLRTLLPEFNHEYVGEFHDDD